MKKLFYYLQVIFITVMIAGCSGGADKKTNLIVGGDLRLEQDESAGTISVFAAGSDKPLVVQNAKDKHRPFLHPILSPDGNGVLTEYSPGHHKHQTGIYWGFTRVNGRDFFHNPGEGYWQKVGSGIVEKTGKEVKWQTIYDLLDDKGTAILRETQNWSMHTDSGKYIISLEWKGEAQTDITVGKYDYGGLFIRMPWKEGMNGEVVNAARERNEKAEGKRAMWVDVGLQVDGRSDLAHIAVFDHPQNKAYPQHWRVDGQLGVGAARSREADWTITKGETETIKHQLYVYTGELNDVALTTAWANFSGSNSTYALWEIARQEGLEAKFLTPEEAVQNMTLKPGYKANVWASEPLMTQPMAFCWDDKGRMWIAENRDYESRGSGFSNAGNSRILILEDTNHDGTADTRKVFMEGIAFPAAIAVGFDGVFIGAPPNLIFVPDRNHDDKADMNDIEIRLTGWGIRDRHETLNSFHWGPDGWLYGCQGFATPSKVKKPKGKGKLYKHKDPFPEDILEGEGTDINGGVWRYHPTKDIFEVVAHGFSNPWGIDYDAKGQLFISACVIPHMWYVIPGGIYHRQGGQHFNPYVYDDIKTITNHSHRSAHGGARIYQSDAFPAEQKGRIFMANIHEHGVLTDNLIPKGSGFEASHAEDFAMANNAQWVGFSMEIGPEGGVYVLDWHDADICGQTVRNTETGRIFRITPENSGAKNFPGRYDDLSKLSDIDLVNLQTSASDWHARRARVILQGRAVKSKPAAAVKAALMKLYESNANVDVRLRALWAMHITNILSAEELLKATDDKEPYIRGWAVQLLSEDRKPSAAAMDKFVAMAQKDNSPVVRLYLASAIQRIGEQQAWQITEALARHTEDVSDHNLPKMIWFGFEQMAGKDPARALKLAGETNIPMIAQYTARRAVDAGAMNELVQVLGSKPKNLELIMEGMLNGMEGRTDLKPPASWQSVYASLKGGNARTVQLANEITSLFGDTEAAQRSLAILTNGGSPVDQRKKAMQVLAAQQRKDLKKELPLLLDDKLMRTDAIRAVAAFDDQSLGQLLLAKYKTFSAADKTEAIQTLSSRPSYGWMLTQAIKKGDIPKKEVSANVARQLRRVVGSGFVEVWGPIEDTPKDDKQFAKYKNMLNDEMAKKADHAAGKLLFQKTCGSCHKMYGEGGIIGPDLTGSNRSNLDYLLMNILNPSEEIQDAYKLVVVTTRDGRTYSGNVIAENQRQITMRIVGQDAVVINKSSIQTREVTPSSMMPQGLISQLSDKEVNDLIGYLRTATGK
jgi:putative membrane-bound dehydrogenase-like protein